MKSFLIYLVLVFLVIVRYFTTLPIYKSEDLVRVTAKLQSSPTYYRGSQNINLSGLSINLPLTYELDYGDRVVIEGLVNKNKLLNPKIISINKSSGILSRVRSKILDFYVSYLPKDHAALLGGIVLGDKSSLTVSFWNHLRNTGTAHVVVASGMNVAFVATFLITTFTLVVKRTIAIPFVVFGIFLYSLLTGFQASIVRAAVMGGLAFLAQETGRIYFSWRILVLTALGMLIAVPSWTTDIGFILTFVATASIMLFQKGIDKKLKFIPDFFRESLSTSIAAQIGVGPIIFVSFGQFNILSPLINAAVLWVVPIIMLVGSLASVVSLVSWKLAAPILYLNYPLTAWFIWIVALFG